MAKFAQSLINTDEVVCELKGEIEKVKHQLNHISHEKLLESEKLKSSTTTKELLVKGDDQQQLLIYKLKAENKKFKREIEAKKKLLEKSRGDVEKAKEILLEYEKKVGLLHVQALKSSKAMKLSKDKFCNCVKERDDKIVALKETNQVLEAKLKENKSLLDDKNNEIYNLNETFKKLKISFGETSAKCSLLTETNQNFYESTEMLRDQLQCASTEIETHKQTIKNMEFKLAEVSDACKRVTNKTKKQKENFENILKGHHEEKANMSQKILEFSIELEKMGQYKRSAEELETKCDGFQEKIEKYESYSVKCKGLEEELKELYDKLVSSEKSFKKDKEEMRKLVTELTSIVQANKVTILQMTEINREQEDVIKTQSVALLTKEEQLQLIAKESENFKLKNLELEKEVEQLKKHRSQPCSREACVCISRELEECRNALYAEKDTQLLKEKIIEDQSQTILNLQSQVKNKMFELNKAQSDTVYLEDEISKINEKLVKKHKELGREVDEKENLIEKLRVLECQRNQLAEEIGDFEEMLQGFKKTCGDNEKQQKILIHLDNQIKEQKQQWEIQKETMAKEKQQAVCAAKFATQKLLHTVEDFQRQVDAQKKVQLLLTKMLHEKDEKLRIVTSKISNINNITKDLSISDRDKSMKELFFRHKFGQYLGPSDVNTNTDTSMYSSCSSCCKKSDCSKNSKLTKSEKSSGLVPCGPPCIAACINTNQIFNLLSNIEKIQEEEPSRDLS